MKVRIPEGDHLFFEEEWSEQGVKGPFIIRGKGMEYRETGSISTSRHSFAFL